MTVAELTRNRADVALCVVREIKRVRHAYLSPLTDPSLPLADLGLDAIDWLDVDVGLEDALAITWTTADELGDLPAGTLGELLAAVEARVSAASEGSAA